MYFALFLHVSESQRALRLIRLWPFRMRLQPECAIVDMSVQIAFGGRAPALRGGVAGAAQALLHQKLGVDVLS